MPQAANIVLADAQATPVSHIYIPLGPDPKDATIFWFEDQSQASPIGYWRISLQVKRPVAAQAGQSADSRVIRVEVGMHQPVLEVLSNSTVSGITPAPTLSYIPRSFLSFVMPERSSLQNRKDLRKMSANVLSDATIVAAVENLVQVY